MLFLGAGASKTFGIKTLQEMSKDLIQMMEKKGYADIIGQVISSLDKFEMAPDFEAIYTIVEGLINPHKAVQESGPFTAYVCKDIIKNHPIHDSTSTDFESLLQLFRDFIYDECKLKRESVEKIKPVYDKLFSMLNRLEEERVLEENRERKSKLTYKIGLGDTVVTTNYDMIVESYYRMKRQDYSDGFRTVEGDPTIKELDLTTYLETKKRWLIKLHGSIYQYKYGNSIFKTIEDPEKSEIPVKIQEKMMIYPTKEKPILKYPYFDFYRFFREQTWNKLVVIGYSFRDEPVNSAILANLERVNHSLLIVVNSNPEKVIQNLGVSVLSQLDDRIIPIQGRFGDEEVFLDLEEALKVESKKRYEERKKERKVIEQQMDALSKRSAKHIP